MTKILLAFPLVMLACGGPRQASSTSSCVELVFYSSKPPRYLAAATASSDCFEQGKTLSGKLVVSANIGTKDLGTPEGLLFLEVGGQSSVGATAAFKARGIEADLVQAIDFFAGCPVGQSCQREVPIDLRCEGDMYLVGSMSGSVSLGSGADLPSSACQVSLDIHPG